MGPGGTGGNDNETRLAPELSFWPPERAVTCRCNCTGCRTAGTHCGRRMRGCFG